MTSLPFPEPAPAPVLVVRRLVYDLTVTPDPGTIEERFGRFHEANPWVLESLVVLADDLIAHGQDRLSISQLWEVLRWHHARGTGEVFQLNNDYRSRYSRLIADTRPDLGERIEMRRLRRV